METEIPQMLRIRETIAAERFTFHSSRMRMMRVIKEELEAMDQDSDRCAAELTDARVDVIGYACLVAIMSMGKGYHKESEKRLGTVANNQGVDIPIVTSAGALVQGLDALKTKKISIITPYMKPLTQLVIDYIEHQGFEVHDSISLEIDDNLAVGRRDPLALCEIVNDLDVSNVDAVVLSACVQMPSWQAIRPVEQKLGIPVISAAVCTTYQMLKSLQLDTYVPASGELLSGKF
jgi:maleate isomerase